MTELGTTCVRYGQRLCWYISLLVIVKTCEHWRILVSIFMISLYHRDDALLYIAYVMLIWAAPIPANRWHCSLWP